MMKRTKQKSVIQVSIGMDRKLKPSLNFKFKTVSGEPFSMDLPTILNCFRIAEREGFIPPVGEKWWNDLRSHSREKGYLEKVHEAMQNTPSARIKNILTILKAKIKEF